MTCAAATGTSTSHEHARTVVVVGLLPQEHTLHLGHDAQGRPMDAVQHLLVDLGGTEYLGPGNPEVEAPVVGACA